MRAAARSLLLLTILTLLFSCASAKADAPRLESVGLRYAPIEGENCLDRAMTDEQATLLLGVSADVALEGMRRDQSYLLILSGDRQIGLCVTDAPDFIQKSDVSELDEGERAQLLDWLRRERAAKTAAWLEDTPDYALMERCADGALQMNTLCMETLYLGKLFSYRLDVLGRELTQEDRGALQSLVARTLRLGATNGARDGELGFRLPRREEATDETLAPLSAPALTADSAEMTADNAEVALALEPVPAILPTNTITLSGTADPEAKLRIRVNGDASSAFSPESDGTFSVTGRRLDNRKSNQVALSASLDGKTTTVELQVAVDMQQTPLKLAATRVTTTGDEATIAGATLPGADVQVTRNNVTGGVEVDAEGRFTVVVKTKKDGNYPFKVKASMLGYKTAKLSGKVSRGEKKTPGYAKLVKKPGDYEAMDISLSGKVAELRYENGAPKCVLETRDGAYVLYCQSLLNIEPGMTLGCDGRLLGANEDYQGQACPTLRVSALTD